MNYNSLTINFQIGAINQKKKMSHGFIARMNFREIVKNWALFSVHWDYLQLNHLPRSTPWQKVQKNRMNPDVLARALI